MITVLNVDTENRIATAEFSGPVNIEDLREYTRRLLSHEHWTPGYHRLLDFSGMTDVQVEGSEIQIYAQESSGYAEELGDGRVALVTSEEFVFGMARIYQTRRGFKGSPPPMKVFREKEAALEWLAGLSC